jgi:TolB-like protein/Flp pilus assembly protein TadD
VTEPSHAVFLSYASQDAQAAQKICDALRAAGIEVFLDQSELRGGDVWDQKIRREIHDCALFIPVISASTASRHEGYFRLEWDLADQRSHMMARSRVFVVPVCLDATTETAADVPESFRRAQWTRLPAGETPPAFVERVQRLLSPEVSTPIRHPARAQSRAVGVIRTPVRASWSLPRGLLVAGAVVALGALAYFAIDRVWISKSSVSSPTVAASPAPAAFTPPPHSVAVLPFVNMSGDKEQEYFSDGLTEELLNSLARINELQVAARTSAFSFKGKDIDIGTIAHKLNVGAVLEGSVRRSGNTVRITTQLINAVTGFHLWSETYDRDLGDVLKLQTDIANAVAAALRVTLLGNVAAKIELGGTHNPAAFEAYLRGRKAGSSANDGKGRQAAIAAYDEAIRLDTNYALAFAGRSMAYSSYAGNTNAEAVAIHELFDKAQADAREAIKLAPELAEAHMALGTYFEEGALDFTRAREAYERALVLAPGNAWVLRASSEFLGNMGQFDEAMAAGRHAVALDPLYRSSHNVLGNTLYYARRYQEASAAYSDAISLDPAHESTYGDRGLAYYGLGDLKNASSSCETKPEYWTSQQCLAIVYDKLGRHADAEAQLARLKAAQGDSCAYQYAAIYAQWGDRPRALEWLDTAMRLRDPGLLGLKTDPLMDPLRKEPRFQAVMRELKFPD